MKISTTWMLCLVAAALASLPGCAGLRSNQRTASAPAASDSPQSTQRAVARLCERRGEADKARQMYALFLQENPRDAEAHHRLAVMACKQGQFAQADQHFSQALAVAPRHPMILADLGYSLYLQNRLPEAEQYLTRALEVDPKLASAHNNLGLVLGQQGRYNESMAMFRRSGSESEAYANLAFIHARQGNLDQAESLYSQALSMNNKLRPAAHGLMQVAHRKQMLRRQGQPQFDPSAIAQAPSMQPLPAVAAPHHAALDLASQGRALPPQFAMNEAAVQEMPQQELESLAGLVQPGRRFVADDYVELVDVSEPVSESQPLPPNARLAGNVDPTPQALNQLISTTPGFRGPPSRFAVGSWRRENSQEASRPEVVQVANRIESVVEAPQPLPALQPAVAVERLQIRYAESVKLKTVEEIPVAEAEASSSSDTPRIVIPVQAAESELPPAAVQNAPLDQQLPRTVFYLGTSQPAVAEVSAAAEPTAEYAPAPAAVIHLHQAVPVEQQFIAPAAAIEGAADVAKQQSTPEAPATAASSMAVPRLGARDSLHWGGAGALRQANSRMDRQRRTSQEFRMAAPQPFSSDSNVSQQQSR